MQNGFEAETTTFINWELVRNKNLAIRDGERKNLFDRIADAHRNGTQFILIIDEEHANDTKKAQDIRQIMAQYKAVVPDKFIRPLVLIQFPSGQPETILAIETKLAEMGYTYENGMIAKWMADEKINLTDNFTANDVIPVFLLMKQAISTGWNCTRAKILIKLLEGMSENFEGQTIGRIRRMPEAKHYEDDLLDFCYVYTFDEKYKAGLLSDVDKAYETRRLFLKDKRKTLTLEKQLKNLDFDGLGERDILAMLHQNLVFKYKLNDDKEQNKRILQSNGYIFGDELINQVLYGEYVHIENITDKNALNVENYRTTRRKGQYKNRYRHFNRKS